MTTHALTVQMRTDGVGPLVGAGDHEPDHA